MSFNQEKPGNLKYMKLISQTENLLMKPFNFPCVSTDYLAKTTKNKKQKKNTTHTSTGGRMGWFKDLKQLWLCRYCRQNLQSLWSPWTANIASTNPDNDGVSWATLRPEVTLCGPPTFFPSLQYTETMQLPFRPLTMTTNQHYIKHCIDSPKQNEPNTNKRFRWWVTPSETMAQLHRGDLSAGIQMYSL